MSDIHYKNISYDRLHPKMKECIYNSYQKYQSISYVASLYNISNQTVKNIIYDNTSKE